MKKLDKALTNMLAWAIILASGSVIIAVAIWALGFVVRGATAIWGSIL